MTAPVSVPVSVPASGSEPGPAALAGADEIAYGLLHQRAVLVDRSARFRVTIGGPKAKEVLNGLLTNDITQLRHGVPMRAAALTPKGRVIALVRVIDRGEELLVDGDAAAGPGFVAMIRKFVNPRLAAYAEVTGSTRCIGVYGPRAAELLANLDLAGVTHVESRDLGVAGVDLIGETQRIDAIGASLEAQGLPVASERVVNVARLEAGVPEWGVEMDAETIPQEANLGELGALSFDKGCFTGQEVVARIHFRGHVNRHLRWLTAEGPLVAGAVLLDGEGKEVGVVRSSVRSPRRGTLAMAMVRREVAVPGEVIARDGVGEGAREVRARVEAIP